MANKAVNFKMDENELLEFKQVIGIFNKTFSDAVKEAIREYEEKLKQDPFYRLTVNVEEASAEESAEILSEIEALTDDDLRIASSTRFTV